MTQLSLHNIIALIPLYLSVALYSNCCSTPLASLLMSHLLLHVIIRYYCAIFVSVLLSSFTSSYYSHLFLLIYCQLASLNVCVCLECSVYIIVHLPIYFCTVFMLNGRQLVRYIDQQIDSLTGLHKGG